MSQHEELELGQHLDQTLRTALVGVTQLVERLSYSRAASDRATAHAIREEILHQRLTGSPLAAGLGPAARDYLVHADPGPAGAVAAWGTAVRDAAAGPDRQVAAQAAAELRAHAHREHGIDPAAEVAAALSDGRANAARRTTEMAAVATAAREEAMIVLPAYRANPDRGVSPSKAATPEEAAHRRQAWQQARAAWETDHGHEHPTTQARQAAWDAMPIHDKTTLYWSHYDTERARTVPTSPGRASSPGGAGSERGTSPSKAGTPEEAEHRRRAWQMAQTGYAETLPAGTSDRDARRAWDELPWQDKALRYWTAYDDPTLQAVETAARAGVVGGAAVVETQEITPARVIELNEAAADYFAGHAGPGSKGRQYFEDRLGPGVVEQSPFRLGYAPPGWTGLVDHLRGAGATDDEILAAGLGRMSSRGNVIDAFRDRAIIAIRDEAGATIGFVGRDLSGAENAPKYVNTAGTVAYTKGDHLLGLHEAPEGARLVRVEGPFDALAVTAAGDGRYAGIAPLGTALTETQADTLADHSGGRLWEALDADSAGRQATEADYWQLSDRGVDTRRLQMPPGSDPAQLWRDNPNQLRDLLADADAASSAALTVIDNSLQDLAPGLRAGDADAHDELAAIQDKLVSRLPEHDRDHVHRYTSAAVAALTDTSRVLAPEPAAAHPPTGKAYDRGATTIPETVNAAPEAGRARADSSPGFSAPTRAMLQDAAKHPGLPPSPSVATPVPEMIRRRRSRG